MRHEILPNGYLKLILHPDEVEELRALKEEQGDDFGSDRTMSDFFESFIANSEFEWVQPEYIGALTDAPILGIYGKETEFPAGWDQSYHNMAGAWDGKLWYLPVEKAWAWMEYQVQSLLDELLENGFAVLIHGEKSCGKCHKCGNPITQTQGREWCELCKMYQQPAGHGWHEHLSNYDGIPCSEVLEPRAYSVEELVDLGITRLQGPAFANAINIGNDQFHFNFGTGEMRYTRTFIVVAAGYVPTGLVTFQGHGIMGGSRG